MSNNLSDEIAKALSEYSDEIAEEVDQAAEEVITETVEELRATSPKRKGKYAKSWAKKRDKKGTWVAHVKAPHYRLTHLLERGHVLKNGGRAKAHVHIAPAEQHAIEKFEERITRLGK